MPAIAGPYGTALLDSFNRANETPILGDWTYPLFVGEDAFNLISNQLERPAAVPFAANEWWRTRTFGPDCEVFINITAKGTNDEETIGLYARIMRPSTSFFTGYRCMAVAGAGTDVFRLARFDNAGGTLLASYNQEFSAGDAFALACIGPRIEAWYWNGSWSRLGWVIDSRYSEAGFFAVEIAGSAGGNIGRYDNFGGGTIAPNYLTTILADNPIAYYRMNESSGQPQDSSGNGNHTTVTNGTPDYSQAGPISLDTTDAGINFSDASNEFFTAPDATPLDYGDTFTIECWLKRTDSSTREQGVVTKGGDGTGHSGGMYLINNFLSGAQTGIGYFVQANVTIPFDGRYYHCVVTKSGATRFVYLNGVDVTNTGAFPDRTCTNTSQPLAMGTEYSAGIPQPVYLTSVVSEVAVYSTALSPSRVLEHYRMGVTSDHANTLPRIGRGLA